VAQSAATRFRNLQKAPSKKPFRTKVAEDGIVFDGRVKSPAALEEKERG